MNIAQAKSIPISEYLAHQGHRPKRTRMGGQELWYRSPIRDRDDTPSFKVDTTLNVWFDHGLARGGNIIDLVTHLCACDVRDALRHLEATHLYSAALSTPKTTRYDRKPRNAASATETAPASRVVAGEKEKSAALKLVSEGPLEHPALLQYLAKRGIRPEVARAYASQIDFKRPESSGNYFAVGYPAGDGFEARNAIFKGFVGTGKNVTFHDKPDSRLLQVFEGFMDYLSYLTADMPDQPVGAVLVLNSTNLWRRALPYLEDPRFDEVRLYLDNDEAGNHATAELFQSPQAGKLADMRGYYAGFEDLNDWLLGRST